MTCLRRWRRWSVLCEKDSDIDFFFVFVIFVAAHLPGEFACVGFALLIFYRRLISSSDFIFPQRQIILFSDHNSAQRKFEFITINGRKTRKTLHRMHGNNELDFNEIWNDRCSDPGASIHYLFFSTIRFDPKKKNCQQTHSAASINLNHVDKHAIQVMIHWHLLNECCKYIKRTQTQPTHTDTLSTQRAKTPFVWFAVRTNVAQWHIIFWCNYYYHFPKIHFQLRHMCRKPHTASETRYYFFCFGFSIRNDLSRFHSSYSRNEIYFAQRTRWKCYTRNQFFLFIDRLYISRPSHFRFCRHSIGKKQQMQRKAE